MKKLLTSVAVIALAGSAFAQSAHKVVRVDSDNKITRLGARVQVIEIEGNRVVVKEV